MKRPLSMCLLLNFILPNYFQLCFIFMKIILFIGKILHYRANNFRVGVELLPRSKERNFKILKRNFRDIKPENILLHEYENGIHLKLCDFATAKDLSTLENGQRPRTFVGSAEYVSPGIVRPNQDKKEKTMDQITRPYVTH